MYWNVLEFCSRDILENLKCTGKGNGMYWNLKNKLGEILSDLQLKEGQEHLNFNEIDGILTSGEFVIEKLNGIIHHKNQTTMGQIMPKLKSKDELMKDIEKIRELFEKRIGKVEPRLRNKIIDTAFNYFSSNFINNNAQYHSMKTQ